MKAFLLSLVTFCLSAVTAFAADGDMRGFATEANDYDQGGIVTLTPTSSSMKLKFAYGDFSDFGFAVGGWGGSCAVYNGAGQYIVTSIKNAYLCDIATGKKVDAGTTTISLQPVSMTYDYIDGRVYGCFQENDTYSLGWFDPTVTPYTVNKIVDGERYVAIAASPDGTLFAITYEGKLWQLDKESGDRQEIGSTGQMTVNNPVGCAAFDWNTGKLYWQHCGDQCDGTLYTVNKTTGAVTKACYYGAWRCLLGFDFEYTYTPSQGTQMPPSAPTDLAVAFDGADMQGQLTFRAPLTNVDGNLGSGTLTYRATADGQLVAEGTVEYGKMATAAVSVSGSGMHTFAVTVSNEAGDSDTSELEHWVGYDKPMPATNITAGYADGKVTLAWAAPEGGLYGGYFNATNLTYEVYCDTRLVCATSATSATDEIGVPTAPTPYIYNVYVVNGDQKSDSAPSRRVVAGAYEVPWLADFNSEEDGLGLFTVIDGGDEDFTWVWKDNAARMPTYGHVASDDWLITPPVHLEAGKEYVFRFDALCGGGGANADERMAAWMGSDATAEAMTTCLLPETSVSSNTYQPYSQAFTPSETGEYYFGLHCTSAIHIYLQVDNICVRAADDCAKPAAVSDLTLTPDPNGELKAVLKFTVPVKDALGDLLTEVQSVKIYNNNGAVTETMTDVRTGQVIEYPVTVDKAGTYRYTVAVTNSKGQSDYASATCYIGTNVPGAITGLTVAETDTWGEVTLTWQAPTVDADGQPLNASVITYSIYDELGRVIVDDVEATTYTYQVVANGEEQKYTSWQVAAVTSAGEGARTATGVLPVGRPTECPYVESFANGELTHTLALVCTYGAAGFEICKDGAEDVYYTSQDEDGGFLQIEGTATTDANNLDIVRIYTGKIAVSGDAPALSFYYRMGIGATNSINVYAEEWQGFGGLEGLNESALRNDVSNEWTRVQLPLTQYAGKTMRFVIEVQNVLDRRTYIDNIRIEDMAANDLQAYNFIAPSKARAGEKMTTSVTVQNTGAQTVSDWHVELLRDGKVVSECAGTTLESGQMCMAYLYDVPPVFADEQVEYSARVVMDGDMVADNDETEAVTVEIVMPEWPSVTNIEGSVCDDNRYLIDWETPEEGDCSPVTDDFEDYPAWEKYAYGEWQLFDFDGLNTLGIVINGASLESPVAGSPASFYVIERSDLAHSGSQCLMAIGSNRGETDDWLISPVLSGEAQTVTFWERGVTPNMPEVYYQLFVSTTTNELSSFESLGTKVQASLTGWKEHSISLPEGTRYFAIRCTQALYTGAFLLDDVTYTPGANSTRDLLGYNIYRDGEKIAYADAAQGDDVTSYYDNVTGSHEYFVTAVYEKGESVPSPTLVLDADGIASMAADAAAGGVAYDLSGRRTERGNVIIINRKKVIGRK